MSTSQDDDPKQLETARKPYRQPTLRVFGSVAAITQTTSMSGAAKDGGPNNIKT